MKRTVALILLLLFMVALAGFYCWEVYHGIPYDRNLGRYVIIEAGLVLSIVKLFRPRDTRRRGLQIYEIQYDRFLGNAFSDDKSSRKKLLTAVRLWDEAKYEKAFRLLQLLKGGCRTAQDRCAVSFFDAKVLTELGLFDEAAADYAHILQESTSDEVKGTVHNNLGFLFNEVGDSEKAQSHYEQALLYTPDNANTYNNIASICFQQGDYEKAKDYAAKALSKNSKLYHASSLLAMVYAIEDNEEESKKYFRMAVSTGESAAKLQGAIDHLLEAE